MSEPAPKPVEYAAETGVVIVTYNSADIIEDCLESLRASEGVALKVVIVDNASADETRSRVAS